MSYGVTENGFVRKPLPVIMNEMQQGMIGTFGVGVIQTAESPLGQLNGLAADLVAELWEIAENVYQSYDPNEAQGIRLEDLGALRLIERTENQEDEDLRRQIVNIPVDRINVNDIRTRLAAIIAVTFSNVYVNNEQEVDAYGVPSDKMVVAISGGFSEDIAQMLYDLIPPGVLLYGTTLVSKEIDGFNYENWIIRPVRQIINARISVTRHSQQLRNIPPSNSVIHQYILGAWNAAVFNGNTISQYEIRKLIEANFPTIEVDTVELVKVSALEVDENTARVARLEALINEIFVLDTNYLEVVLTP